MSLLLLGRRRVQEAAVVSDPITQVGTPTSGVYSSGGSGFATTLPTGWAADDVFVLVVGSAVNTATHTTPTDWTLIGALTDAGQDNSGTADVRGWCYTRVAVGGMSAPTFPASSNVGGWVMGAYRNVDTAAPLEDVSHVGTASGTSHASGAVDVVSDGVWLVSAAMADLGVSVAPYWTIGSMSKDVEVEGTNIVPIALAHEELATTGSITRTWTSANADSGVVFLLALKPAPGESGSALQTLYATELALNTSTADDTSHLNNPLSGVFGDNYTATSSSLPLTEKPLTTGNERFYWNEFEVGGSAGSAMPSGTDPGTYDWSVLDAYIIAQAASGRRAHFRIRAMGTSDTSSSYLPGYLRVAPYSAQSASGGWVPNFNNSRVLDRMEAFITALCDHILTDPDIAGMVWGMDAGMMGKFGEWVEPTNNASLGFSDMTLASFSRVVDAYLTGLAGSPIWLILHSIDKHQDVLYTYLPDADTNGHKIGLRSDGWGNATTSTQLSSACYHPTYTASAPGGYQTIFLNWWQAHPIIGEPWTQYANGAGGVSSRMQSASDNGFDFFVNQQTGGDQTGMSIFASHTELLTRNLHGAAVANHNIISRNSTDTAGATWPGAGSYAFTTEHQRQAYEAFKRGGYRYRMDQVRVSGATAGGTLTVEIDWHNDGITPIYFPFLITLQLYDGVSLEASNAMATDLQTILPTGGAPVTETGTLSLSGITAGTYELRVIITDDDPRGVRWPALLLAQSGRNSGDGSYTIGNVVVQ